MEIDIITKEDLQQFKNELLSELKETLGTHRGEVKEWLDTREVMELLGIKSKTTLQKLRDTFEIKFSQNGKIIKYFKPSIIEFLERNVPKL